jgi:hypothetical protein
MGQAPISNRVSFFGLFSISFVHHFIFGFRNEDPLVGVVEPQGGTRENCVSSLDL